METKYTGTMSRTWVLYETLKYLLMKYIPKNIERKPYKKIPQHIANNPNGNIIKKIVIAIIFLIKFNFKTILLYPFDNNNDTLIFVKQLNIKAIDKILNNAIDSNHLSPKKIIINGFETRNKQKIVGT